MAEINGWAVLVAAFASFMLGGPWYSKALFLNAWQREAGDTRGARSRQAPGPRLRPCFPVLAGRGGMLRGRPRTAARVAGRRGLRPAGGCGHCRGQLWHQLPVRQPQPHLVVDRWWLPHRAVSFVWLGARPLAL